MVVVFLALGFAVYVVRLVCILFLILVFDLIRRLFFLKRVDFANMHVLVTGGSQGIGRATAARLLARGARVTLLSRTEAKLQTAVAELREAEANRRAKTNGKLVGGEVSVQYVCADQTNWAQLTSAVARARRGDAAARPFWWNRCPSRPSRRWRSAGPA